MCGFGGGDGGWAGAVARKGEGIARVGWGHDGGAEARVVCGSEVWGVAGWVNITFSTTVRQIGLSTFINRTLPYAGDGC